MGESSLPLSSLLNLGPTSQRWLKSVGIYTRDDLERVGPVLAHKMVAQAGYQPSLNLLYAMHGALDGTLWSELSPATKNKLKRELQAVQE